MSADGLDFSDFVSGLHRGAVPPTPLAARSAVLTGAARSGKSGLLMQLALAAARRGEHVVYVSSTRRSRMQFPPTPPAFGAAAADQEALGRVGLKYLADFAELELFLAHFHRLPGPPSLLVIDELDPLCRGVSARRQAELLGCLTWNAMGRGAKSAEGKARGCKLVVARSAEDALGGGADAHGSKTLTKYLQRNLALMLETAQVDPGGDSALFELRTTEKCSLDARPTARFRVDPAGMHSESADIAQLTAGLEAMAWEGAAQDAHGGGGAVAMS